jgi:hypothetical protein
MKIFRIHTMSVPGALLLSAVIIGVSIFLTVLVFFGGNGNRQKLFLNPSAQKAQTPTMNPDQIKKMQEQRAAQLEKQRQEAAQRAAQTTIQTTEVQE